MERVAPKDGACTGVIIITLHLLIILLLGYQSSSLFSRQLSVRVCRKSVRVEDLFELQITSLKYKFTRLT